MPCCGYEGEDTDHVIGYCVECEWSRTSLREKIATKLKRVVNRNELTDLVLCSRNLENELSNLENRCRIEIGRIIKNYVEEIVKLRSRKDKETTNWPAVSWR